MANVIDKILGLEKKIGTAVQEAVAKSTFFKSFIPEERKQSKYSLFTDKSGKKYADAYIEEIYIYGCVYLISNTIAKLPLRVYIDNKSKNGKTIEKIDITEQHPANALFLKPNFKDSFYDLKEQISANIELTGNTYLLLDKQNSKGIPESVYCLNSRHMEIIPYDKPQKKIESIADIIKEYRYGDVSYSPSQILQEKKFGIESEYYGQSPVAVAGQIIDTTRESRNRNFAIFKNGISGENAFETDAQYNEILYKRLEQDIANKYQGSSNYHKPYILFGGLKLKNIGISQKDLEFIQGMKLSREEICGFIYQVPPILLGILENSSYNNISEATKIFYNFSIKPRLVKIEELFQKLIDIYGVEGAYCEFDLSDVEELRENISAKIQSAQQLFSIGVPLNQIITALNLPLQHIAGGDTGYIPFSLMPIGSTREIPEKPTSSPEGTEGQEEKKPKKLKAKAFTEQMLEAKWKQFASDVKKNEFLYMSDLKPYFRIQKEMILANLEKYKSITAHKIGNNAFAIIGIDEANVKKPLNINAVLFDDKKEVKRLQLTSKPHYTNAIKDSAEAEFQLLGIEQSFNVENPEVRKWVQDYGLSKAKLVVENMKEVVKDELVAGLNEGESIPELMKRISNVYDAKMEDFQLERIARTEIVGASNQGALFSYKEAGVEKKAWLSAFDERTRETHIEASIKYADGIPIDQEFEIGADRMMTAGQGNLPEENINCRCTIIPIISKEGE